MHLFRHLYTRLLNMADALRESYWFVPTLMVALAPVLVYGMQALDQVAYDSLERYMPSLYRVNESGIRAVLSVIAGSMMTVTGVVFSMTMVTLTLASSQYGPRLLRTFLRDRTNQFVLGVFTMTFVYSLIVLWMVGAWEYTQINTLFAVVLAVLSLLVLIYFIHHTSHSIQASSIISSLYLEVELQLKLLCQKPNNEVKQSTDSDVWDRDHYQHTLDIASKRQGYVRLMSQDSLWRVACNKDVMVEVHAMPGQFVVEGARLLTVFSEKALEKDDFLSLRESFVLGDTRTGFQDVEYLIEQMVEVAVRALSPGVNDPTTAIACINRLCAAICIAAPHEFSSNLLCDDNGVPRILRNGLCFDRLLAQAFDSIGNYARSDVHVVEVLLAALERIASFCQNRDRLEAVLKQGEEVKITFETVEIHTPRDNKRIHQRHEQLDELVKEQIKQLTKDGEQDN